MEAPFDDLAKLFRRTLKTLNPLSIELIATVVVALNVAEVYVILTAIQPYLGIGFLLLLAVGLAVLLGPPADLGAHSGSDPAKQFCPYRPAP